MTIVDAPEAVELQRLLANADRPAATDPLRFSRLKMIGQSPAHYRGSPSPDGSGLDVGSAAHSMILGGKRIVAYPGPVRRGKEWDAFERDNGDALILTRREYAVADGIAESVKSNPDAMRVLDGEREQTFTWQQFGRPCRGTPDVRGHKMHTELKTGETADPRRFPWKMLRFCYHGQMAFYSDGAALAGLEAPEHNYVVAVEATPPYVTTVFRIGEAAIDQGRRLIRLWFEQLRACEEADFWPGYSQSIVPLDLPGAELELDDAGGDA